MYGILKESIYVQSAKKLSVFTYTEYTQKILSLIIETRFLVTLFIANKMYTNF
jgi:hypothetical protein